MEVTGWRQYLLIQWSVPNTKAALASFFFANGRPFTFFQSSRQTCAFAEAVLAACIDDDAAACYISYIIAVRLIYEA